PSACCLLYALSLHDALPIYRMSNIPELTVRCSFRGHCYKKSVISIDDANVVNDKLIIHCNRSNGPHPALRVYAAKSDVSNLHDRSEEHTSELQSRFDLVCRL